MNTSWVKEVLSDIARFAEVNGMQDLSDALVSTAIPLASGQSLEQVPPSPPMIESLFDTPYE